MSSTSPTVPFVLGASAALVARVARAPATWLSLVVGGSTLVRGAIGFGVPSPWILPDEVVYSELAKSIAEGSRPAVRGVPVLGWGEVYPTLIAPAWALFEDPVWAYHASLAINSLVMSLAAVPAYFLARMFVSQQGSILVAGMTVLVPSMAYTGVVMTENAFYPVFLLSVLLIARAVRWPSTANQTLAVLGLALVVLTRIQGIALVGAYLASVVVYALTGSRAERSGYVRRFVPTAALAALAALVPVVASVARGRGLLGWLGPRTGTFDAMDPAVIPKWVAYLAAGLVLYVAVAPAVASVVMATRGLGRRASDPLRLFTAVWLPTVVAMLLSVAFVSASVAVDGTRNLNERYVFYVVPLLFLGLALWIESGLPRPRPSAWIALAVAGLLPAFLPIDQLDYNAGFQSVALLPWLAFSLSGAALAVCVLAFTSACGLVWSTCHRDTVGRLWVFLAATLAFVGVATVLSNATTASQYASAFPDRSPDWVDVALPKGANVVVVWDETTAGAHSPGEAYYWLMATEFFNSTVGDVYRIGRSTHYEAVLPTVPVRVRPDAKLEKGNGEIVRSRFVLATCRTRVQGELLARAPRGVLQLIRVTGAVALLGPGDCPAGKIGGPA